MMFDFGDELIIESYKIPWLIWIQLLVTILFIILLFGISFCTSDEAAAASTPSTIISSSTSTGRATIVPPPNLNNPSSSQRTKAEEIQRIERNGEASGGTIIEDEQERDESSSNDSVLQMLFKRPTQSCNYLGRLFLKCFGLDTSSKSPSNEKHETRLTNIFAEVHLK